MHEYCQHLFFTLVRRSLVQVQWSIERAHGCSQNFAKLSSIPIRKYVICSDLLANCLTTKGMSNYHGVDDVKWYFSNSTGSRYFCCRFSNVKASLRIQRINFMYIYHIASSIKYFILVHILRIVLFVPPYSPIVEILRIVLCAPPIQLNPTSQSYPFGPI